MTDTGLLPDKIREIMEELKQIGLWRRQAPAWVQNYAHCQIATEQDFAEWLQFVYLPNCLSQPVTDGEQQIVPQAMQFFGEDVKKGQLLRLLIELDSLL